MVAVRQSLEFYGSCTLAQDGCATCGDVAVPVRVIAVDNNEAVVEDRTGYKATVAIDFLSDVKCDDVLIVHMGVAISKAGDRHEIR